MLTSSIVNALDAGSELFSVPRLLLHHIDVINEEYISGWCFHRIIPRHSLRLEFQLGTEPIGHTFCNKARVNTTYLVIVMEKSTVSLLISQQG